MDPSHLHETLELLKANPKDIPLLMAAGELYAQSQKWNEAVFYMAQTLKYDPNHLPAYRELGKIFIGAGDMAQGLLAYEQGKQAAIRLKDPAAESEFMGLIQKLGGR